jgi:hypothetical protein
MHAGHAGRPGGCSLGTWGTHRAKGHGHREDALCACRPLGTQRDQVDACWAHAGHAWVGGGERGGTRLHMPGACMHAPPCFRTRAPPAPFATPSGVPVCTACACTLAPPLRPTRREGSSSSLHVQEQQLTTATLHCTVTAARTRTSERPHCCLFGWYKAWHGA